jgi:hypothetical protein
MGCRVVEKAVDLKEEAAGVPDLQKSLVGLDPYGVYQILEVRKILKNLKAHS